MLEALRGLLSDDAAARKAAGLKAEAPKPLVKKRGGRVAAAVSAAAARPKAKAAPKGEHKHETPKAEKTARPKKPSAKPDAAE